MSWPSERLLAVASAWRARSAARRSAVLFGGVAHLVVVEARAAEVGLLAGGLAVGVGELLADGVDHEHRVDDPDAGGEVLAAVEHPAVAAVGGAVAQRRVDAQLERAAAGAGGERVELGVELVGLAAERGGGFGVALGGRGGCGRARPGRRRRAGRRRRCGRRRRARPRRRCGARSRRGRAAPGRAARWWSRGRRRPG